MTALDSAADARAHDRLWDLRQGDADDNRTSPYGRGWRNVIVSTALEFNYLTASVSFLGGSWSASAATTVSGATRSALRSTLPEVSRGRVSATS